MFRINPQFQGVKTSNEDELLKLCQTNVGELHRRQCSHYFDSDGNVCIESLAGFDDIRFYCWLLVVDRVVNLRGTRWTFRDAGEKLPTTPSEIF